MKTRFIRHPLCAAIALTLAIVFFGLTQRSTALSIKRPCLAEADAGTASGDGSSTTRRMKIQVVEPDAEKKEVAWLGVSTEEAPDVLSAQLGLSPGDGLVILFVQPESPASKAGLQKNDLLVEFGDQLLVHPEQFRKLVRRQKEGDKIKLTLY